MRDTDPQPPLGADDFAVLGRIALIANVGRFPQGIDHALDVLRVGVGADACEIFLLDGACNESMLIGCSGPDAKALQSQERFDIGVGFPGIIAQEGVAFATSDLANDQRYLREQVVALGYHSYASTPLRHGSRVLGSLHLAWKRPAPQMARGLRLLDAAGPTFAATILASFSPGDHPECSGLPLTLKAAAEAFREAAGADEATVAIKQDGGGIAECGSTGAMHLLCDHLSKHGLENCEGRLLEGRGVVLDRRRSSWPVTCRSLPRGFKRVVEVPLVHDAQPLGVVLLGYRKEPSGPSRRLLPALLAMGQEFGDILAHRPVSDPSPEPRPPVVAASEPHLRLQCFGSFAIYIDGNLVPRRAFRRSRSVRILQILLLRRGRPISRDALVEQLWPSSDLECGARSLHVAMHCLRKTIEPEVVGKQWAYVQCTGDNFYLDTDDSCVVDLYRFRELISLSQKAMMVPGNVDHRVELLEEAIELYRGDLFSDSPDFPLFEAERETLRQDYLQALLTLSDLCERHYGGERCIGLLRQAAAQDLLREDIQRQLVRALLSAGRKGEARRTYERCVDALQAQFGVGPTREMLRIGALLNCK